MDTYSDKLKAWLRDTPQAAFAAQLGKTQSAVSRYANGIRKPDASTAREIDRLTSGAVPYEAWQAEVLSKLGIGA